MGEEKPNGAKRHIKITAGVIILLALGFGVGMWLTTLRSKVATIPDSIAQHLAFPTYLPSKLPGNYTVNKQSFGMDEATLVFSATDGTGSAITFTEQKRPADFDFEDFYANKIESAKTISNTPFPSVSGRSPGASAEIVSIVTDETWIIITSRAPLGDQLHDIARHLERQ